MESKGKAFRALLGEEPYVFTGGIYSPLDAEIAERAGMKAIYMSGYSVAMLNGWPDMGFLTMSEMTRTASMIASAVEIPIIADADDGYGSALNTMRTVAEFVKSGVAGIHLEDQQLPKRCGHLSGKVLVDAEVMRPIAVLDFDPAGAADNGPSPHGFNPYFDLPPV